MRTSVAGERGTRKRFRGGMVKEISPKRRARTPWAGRDGVPIESSSQGVWRGERYPACVATPSFVPYVMPKLFSKSTLICRNCASGAHPSVAVEEGTEAPDRWPVRGVEGGELVQIHVRQT